MTAISYWNDWTNGLYYLTENGGSQYYTIQLVLNRINENINFLANNSDVAAKAAQQLPSTTMRMATAVSVFCPSCARIRFSRNILSKVSPWVVSRSKEGRRWS